MLYLIKSYLKFISVRISVFSGNYVIKVKLHKLRKFIARKIFDGVGCIESDKELIDKNILQNLHVNRSPAKKPERCIKKLAEMFVLTTLIPLTYTISNKYYISKSSNATDLYDSLERKMRWTKYYTVKPRFWNTSKCIPKSGFIPKSR